MLFIEVSPSAFRLETAGAENDNARLASEKTPSTKDCNSGDVGDQAYSNADKPSMRICATINGMDREELREYAHSILNELSQRQLEAVVGILQCITGRDESDNIAEVASGEGLPPADLFNKFFS
jgi:hypothetical protein